jgi:hypothetical protein
MPTLSREYDQHFKSFTGIPTIVPEYSLSTSAFSKDTTTDSNAAQQSLASSSSFRGLDKQTRKSSTSGQDIDNEDSEDAIKAKEETSPSSSIGNEKPTPSNYPKMRGSRCFEVLGFDIMIDHALKPWIIEVNHLPRYLSCKYSVLLSSF